MQPLNTYHSGSDLYLCIARRWPLLPLMPPCILAACMLCDPIFSLCGPFLQVASHKSASQAIQQVLQGLPRCRLRRGRCPRTAASWRQMVEREEAGTGDTGGWHWGH